MRRASSRGAERRDRDDRRSDGGVDEGDDEHQAAPGAGGYDIRPGVVNYPHCCPSRATFFTGRYAHNHGVLGTSPSTDFSALDTSDWLPGWLQGAGYHTVHIGKLINGYGALDSPEELPGFDEWYATRDPSTYQYYGYSLNENGVPVTYGEDLDPESYQTDVLTSKAVEAIGRLAPSSQPFFLNLSYVAPHNGLPNTPDDPQGQSTPDPAPRHRDRFSATPLPRPPNFNESDVSDKPEFIRRTPSIGPVRTAQIQENYQQRLESLLAVDEGVQRVTQALSDAGELEDTLIVFTSDNGFMHGEHRRAYGKLVVYEPSIRVPLILRGPGVPRAAHRGQLVTNADLAPTILEAAEAEPQSTFDGLSLFGFLRNPGKESKRLLLIQAVPTSSGGDGLPHGYVALRTPNFLYAEHGTGEQELYDLSSDRYELSSRHADPAYAGTRATLARWLGVLRACTGAQCTQPPR